MMAISDIKVAISSEFMTAFADIPKKTRGKIVEFIEKFKNNPMAASINYEKIIQFKDPSLRSVRIDQTYRGIVKKPDKGNVYILLWVDHHDKAYEWAKNKKCSINPEAGSLQVYDVQEMADKQTDDISSYQEYKDLFFSIHDRHLMKLGVPEELLPLVRSIKTEDQLLNTINHLPAEAGEALIGLATGMTLDEVLRENGKTFEDNETIDTDDYDTALENSDTKRRFFVIEDDLALKEIFEAPLDKWRVFLHPTQRSLVEKNWNGPVRVLGGAGTGKTVVAIHRAKWLAENVFTDENDKILFTTFTRNLAADIKNNLAKICSDKIMQRIDVVNLDRWVIAFLKRNIYPHDIDYGEKTQELWIKALSKMHSELDLDKNFYREEWDRIIQPQGITTLEEYLKISRVGRGTRLSAESRIAVWTVFEEYRSLMNDKNICEVDDALRDACSIIRDKGIVLPYKAVIVDEAQDMSTPAFKLIRQLVPDGEQKNDLFIVGDAYQRIYPHKVVLSHCGINIKGRGKRLKINYRTTEENRRWAVSLFKGIRIDDLDGNDDDQNGYTSLIKGFSPKIVNSESFQKEIELISQHLEDIIKTDGSTSEVCLVSRTHDLLKQYEGALRSKGFDTYFIDRKEPEDTEIQGLRLATMHRVKGLEFERVIIAGVNEGVLPLEKKWIKTNDPIIKGENEMQERALLYVSATRAKKDVLISSFGKSSRFLQLKI
jgi:superfamily I DNA/RNA helicase/mRNA-degrading endonuclease RelE of RelBE toxin-antitoxin system